MYYNAYGLEELWKLSGYEFLNQLIEFIEIQEGKLGAPNSTFFKQKPFWSKYFKLHFHQNLKKSEKPRFPKFIHYAAHAETLAVFLEALGIRRITRVPPGGALFIEFVRLYKEGESINPSQLHLRFYLYNDLDHKQNGHKIKMLDIPLLERVQGSMHKAADFKEHIKNRL